MVLFREEVFLLIVLGFCYDDVFSRSVVISLLRYYVITLSRYQEALLVVVTSDPHDFQDEGCQQGRQHAIEDQS